MICIDNNIIGKGAEAVLILSPLFSNKTVIKKRIPKSYRPKPLDEKVRKGRNAREVRVLHRAKMAGVPAPVVLEVGEFYYRMNYIEGKRPKPSKELAMKMAKLLSKLHSQNIIHGDFTPANVIESKDSLFVIDFGLGFISNRIEDKADDLLALIYSLKEYENVIIEEYTKEYKHGKAVVERMNDIKRRMRYAFDKLKS